MNSRVGERHWGSRIANRNAREPSSICLLRRSPAAGSVGVGVFSFARCHGNMVELDLEPVSDLRPLQTTILAYTTGWDVLACRMPNKHAGS